MADEDNNGDASTSREQPSETMEVDTNNAAFDILAERPLKLKDNIIINSTKSDQNAVSNDDKRNGKLQQISSEYEFDEIVAEISSLKLEECENLFVFVINCGSFNDEFNEFLHDLKTDRPMILQIKSEDEKEVSFYYKDGGSCEFFRIEINSDENLEITDFPSFFNWFMTVSSKEERNAEDVEKMISNELDKIVNIELALRFLNIFECSYDVNFKKIIKCARHCSKLLFFAALDVPFGNDGRLLKNNAHQFICELVKGAKPDEYASVLEAAVDNPNKDIFEYLITYCSHWIQKLPFDHQAKIFSKVFENKESKLLSLNLLDCADFPFPENFSHELNIHQKIKDSIDKRTELHEAIRNGNLEEIRKITENLQSRIAYNTDNKSALYTALEKKKFDVFFELTSLGYNGTDYWQIEKNLTREEKDEMDTEMNRRYIQNIELAQSDPERFIPMLCARTRIHNPPSETDKQDKYRDTIKKWYEGVQKSEYGNLLISYAAQCDKLRIIMDFECEYVERVDPEVQGAYGIMDPGQKVIIIGAKHSEDNKQKQMEIKGTIAHEMMHYVFGMMFQNDDNPYFNKSDKRYEIFTKIVAKYKQQFAANTNDGCGGIISSVFSRYDDILHPCELAVRVTQILVQFHNNQKKIAQMKTSYGDLFDFHKDYVVPEMEKLDFKKREAVRHFNKYPECISEIRKRNCQFLKLIDVKQIISNKLVVVPTNVPKLLLNEIYNYLSKKVGKTLDTKNVFINHEKLNNDVIRKEFEKILEKVNGLNVFVDFSSGTSKNLDIFSVNSTATFIFIVSNEDQAVKLAQLLKNIESDQVMETIIYSWNDLKSETKKLLFETKVNFQNNQECSFADLLGNETDVIDDKLLNVTLSDSKVPVNLSMGLDARLAKDFGKLFIERKFILNGKKLTQKELLEKVSGKKYVLLSDGAGSGKSWCTKNMSKVLHEKYPTKWVTFVDLKQHIETFRSHGSAKRFLQFFTENILKPESKFEEKVFERRYASGNALIFFDAFDEIAPDCAIIVKELIKSFESNGENQLWITTRDFFEVDLQKELQDTVTCKLDDFTKENGIELK